MSHLLVKELKSSRYRLLGLVGQGQFGRVYCASHRRTGHLVALKELRKERFPTHKFLRELRFLLSLQHPNIVNCHALEHTLNGRYLVMDYCEGGTLRNLMEEGIRLHPAYSLKLVEDVLAGLAHAHSRGIIHCDIKPENILLTVQPDGWTARISDFGIARLSQEISRDGTGNTGSPAYMAPERFYGQYSHSSDIYAVGVLLFELLTGDRPFSGQPAELMSAHLNKPVKIPETIPPGLQKIILTALQKLPARRFHSALEMLTEVEAAATNLQSEFSAEWAQVRLLQATTRLPICAFKPLRQEILHSRVKQVVGELGSIQSGRAVEFSSPRSGEAIEPPLNSEAAGGDRVYRVFGNYVGHQRYPAGIFQTEPDQDGEIPLTTIRLPDAVQQVVVRSQGCFAITQRAVYWLPTRLWSGVAQHRQMYLSPGATREHAPDEHLLPQLIAEFRQDFTVAIAPNSQWMATVPLEPARGAIELSFWHLGQPHLIKTLTLPSSSHFFQLMALDSRHVALFSHTVDSQANACITGALVEILTRRGNAVGSLKLPVPLYSLVASPTPYRLLGMEPGHPNTVLLIDLKPLRISRIGLEISPILAAANDWGYILMAADGQIALLDNYGQTVGRIEGPPDPVAIATLNPYGLLVSTWKNGQGNLYALDLRQLDLEFMF